MKVTKRKVRKDSFVPRFTMGYERFSYSPKNDAQVLPTGFKSPKYQYIVEWQLDVEVVNAPRLE